MENNIFKTDFIFNAINGITNLNDVRLVLYSNGNLSHISLKKIFIETDNKIIALEQKLAHLESKINEKKN